jgi:NAD(P)-dependent dehydrogenase (short-subunit alcohol dehydrogenase family)
MQQQRKGRLDGKVVLMGGAGTSAPGMSIGKATSLHFAREGATVFAVDVNLAAAREVCELIAEEGFNAVSYEADLADAGDIEKMTAACIEQFGRIDVLNYNVGIGTIGGPVELPVEEWDRISDLNVRGLYLACKSILPQMVRQGSGAIVAISSIAGMRYPGFPHMAYGVTKAAMIQLTRYIALQYARQGIRANSVLPGMIDTPRIARVTSAWSDGDFDDARRVRDGKCPMGHTGSPWDIAYAAAFLASDEARYITATELIVDGGLTGIISTPNAAA